MVEVGTSEIDYCREKQKAMSAGHIALIASTLVCLGFLVFAIFFNKPASYQTNFTFQVDPAELESRFIINEQIQQYNNDLKKSYDKTVEDMENKYTSLLTILGIAVSVWVGLNIGNIIDKNELRALRQEMDNLKIQQSKMRAVMEESIAVTRELAQVLDTLSGSDSGNGGSPAVPD